MLKKYKFTGLFLGWMVLITSLSLFSFSMDKERKIWFPHLDKLVHFAFHFFIVVFGALLLREQKRLDYATKKKLWLLLGFSVAYGLVIELLQYLLPYNRSAEIWDVLANTAGAIMGILLIQRYSSLIDGPK